jgi:hypothetical protein
VVVEAAVVVEEVVAVVEAVVEAAVVEAVVVADEMREKKVREIRGGVERCPRASLTHSLSLSLLLTLTYLYMTTNVPLYSKETLLRKREQEEEQEEEQEISIYIYIYVRDCFNTRFTVPRYGFWVEGWKQHSARNRWCAGYVIRRYSRFHSGSP